MLKSLKGIKVINGKKVMTNEERPKDIDGNIDWNKFDEMREEYPVCIDHNKDMISFKMLTKPASEGGNLKNAQWIELISTGLAILRYLNSKHPCRENSIMIAKLQEVIMWNDERTRERISRGVEGIDTN